MLYANVKVIIFKNKQNIKWNEVEKYLKTFIGKRHIVKVNGDEINVESDFPDEYAGSKYTKKYSGH